MIAARKRTAQDTARRAHHARLAPAALASLTGLVAVTVTVAACGSTQAPTTAGSSSGPSATSSGGATLQASAGVCTTVPKLTGLSVHRVNDLPQNHLKFVFPATEVVTSAAQVQTVARSLCALPQQTRPVTCPNDNGVSYKLTFSAGSKQYSPVTTDASGCPMVYGLGKPRTAATAQGLWQDLGLAIGIPHPSQDSFSGTQATTNTNS
jgi:hypothetical protein